MNLILTAIFFVAVTACFPLGTTAQTFSKIREKAVGMVEAKYPESGRIRKEMTLKREEEKQAFYNWEITEKGKQRWIVIKIFYGNTREETAQFMQVSSGNIQVGPGTKRSDLGDEAYYSEDVRTEFARVRFRKANVYIDIRANSLAEAEQLAREFEKFIKKK